MRHCTLEELLALDEAGSEPGTAWVRSHVDECPACRAERDRLDQRRARIRALPALRPVRDKWPAVQARLRQERGARRLRWIGAAGLTAAASIALALVLPKLGPMALPQPDAAAVVAEQQLERVMQQSQTLEAAIDAYGPEQRVVDGRTGLIAADLEDRIAEVDRRLQVVELERQPAPADMLLPLWKERVGLLDALVDVHVTRASHVGL